MKAHPFVLLCLLIVSFSNAQQKAVTETGDEVILYDDGTWKYLDEDQIIANDVPINPNKFETDDKSTFLLKSNTMNIGVYLNPKIWSFKKAVDNSDAEFEFQLKDGDLYGMLISEKVEIPLETMRTIAVENGREAAPDLKIVKEEYRNVNGIQVLLLQMNGTMQGIKFSYYGYYFSNANGTVQFITYTAQSLIETYKPESERLLNGLVELK